MERQDVICCNCGKFLFTEQKEAFAGNIHRLNKTNDEYYNPVKDEFYCTKCAKVIDLRF